jgi:hypothetical protein
MVCFTFIPIPVVCGVKPVSALLLVNEHFFFFQQYDVTNLGEPGGGGEYIVQKGFGWTNGAILDMIVRTNTSLSLDLNGSYVKHNGTTFPVFVEAGMSGGGSTDEGNKTGSDGGSSGRFNASNVANYTAVVFLIGFALGFSLW